MVQSLRILAFALAVLSSACASTWRGSVGAIFALEKRSGKVVVRDAPTDMAAARAGILVGDEVVAIDGVSTKGMDPSEIHAKLEGEVGSKVHLLVRRNDEVKDIVVERGPLKDDPRQKR